MTIRRFLPFALSLLLLGACGASTPPTADVPGSGGANASAKAPFKFVPYTEASSVPGPDVRVIDVEAKNFAFLPATIALKQGEKVALKVTSTSGNHSVMIADLGINVKVPEGQTMYVPVPTDKAGTFQFRCAVPCGPGHLDMIGTIEIQ